MILLGGLTTLHGPIIGALAYVGLLREVAIPVLPERTLLVEGLVILADRAGAATRPDGPSRLAPPPATCPRARGASRSKARRSDG